MPIITLPDGSQRSFDEPITVAEVAASIGAGLAKACLAGQVNGQAVDASFLIEDDCQLSILTAKSEDGLEVIRHSCAHLMAQAVQQLYPKAQVTIGPVIEDGFYYDFAYEPGFTPEDMEKIETRMQAIAQENLPVKREVMPRDEAIALFEGMGETFKAEIIRDLPEDETLSLYRQGDFVDLCRGPHVPSTGHIKAFKLMKLAGAYWRGDANNVMLQRIYGTAWADKKELQAYLHRLEEAERRDHRKLGKKWDLFHIQKEAPGMVFWHPNGWTIYQIVRDFMRQKFQEHGYQEINTPQLVDRTLWEKSGHWDKFSNEMFTTQSEDRDMAVKPMSCPCHVQVFNQGLTSYKALPVRLAEFGCCHRNELSGALHGLMRVRGLTQDDGHIFCTHDQILGEVSSFVDQLFEVYKVFGFEQVMVKLSTRPEQRVGSDEVWDKAEQSLEQALNEKGLDWELQPGEGAFYGPKVEFTLKDSIGRLWQCGTIQLDFSMPVRLEAHYVDEEGNKQHPVMLHRAVLGSLERFIGILLEEYADGLPTWLAPMQCQVVAISDKHANYARQVCAKMKEKGIRAREDLRQEKINYKIRDHAMARVPYIIVVGDREMEQGQVSVRTRDGQQLGAISVDEWVNGLVEEIASRALSIRNEGKDH